MRLPHCGFGDHRCVPVGFWGCVVLGLVLGCAPTENSEFRLSEPKASTLTNHPPPLPPTRPPSEPRPAGLLLNDPRAFHGYTLIAPLMSTKTYLIDMNGHIVHTWTSDALPAMSARLLPNGNLLRPCQLPENERHFTHSGGGGRIQEFTWDGELVWDFRFHDARHLPHHDAIKLPNGNVLLVICERIPVKEAEAAGRKPHSIDGEYLLVDALVEIRPTGRTTGEVVWRWRVWDHLIQEFDPTKPNYGAVADHPERIDLNYGVGTNGVVVAKGADVAKLQALGYLGSKSSPAPGTLGNADFTHINSVAYNPELDQIAITGLTFSEIWIIDHSTTIGEAASSSGGQSGHGGDLLYRWGNPRAYRHGTNADQQLFGPHDVQWIAKGSPGHGNLLVFNNGVGRPREMYSSVEEIQPPRDATGRYQRPPHRPFGPAKPLWSYHNPVKPTFFSPTFSGAQRLPNGNTLACVGMAGCIHEVTPQGNEVWKFSLSHRQNELPMLPPPPVNAPPLPPGVPGMPAPATPMLVPGEPLFRALRYAPDYPAFIDKDLSPKDNSMAMVDAEG
ncbi:MAG: aryl-sulfate sulfotransferase [Gemmataceae bacterium]|nr:aryl-sulfate sulfotransferase [Gemmata sp.]MDW8197854.1 aryl-sulfate sulfotransferase [Gemmataceae bacterium]